MMAKRNIKILVDLLMTLLLFAVMAYPITGESLHKQLGIGLFISFFLHHFLNWKWYRSITKGSYSAIRLVYLGVNTLLLLSMIGLMVSGFLLSTWAYQLGVHAGAFGRKLHMLSASWGYFLISMHIGFHWGTFAGMLRKKIKIKVPRFLCRLFAVFMVVYGIYEAAVRQLFFKMFWLVDYAFYDFSEPAPLFLMDYIFMMGSFGILSFLLMSMSGRNKRIPFKPAKIP